LSRTVPALRRIAAALAASLALGLIGAPATASAHGGVTGMQDVVQDYGVLIFLMAVVLIGAGVLTWVMLSPQEEEPEESDASG
jgi:hypothetical protein